MRREFQNALSWIALGLSLLGLVFPPLHITPTGTLPTWDRGHVSATTDFARGKVFLLNYNKQIASINLACRTGLLFWTECGTLYVLKPTDQPSKMGASVTQKDRIGDFKGLVAFAGIIENPQVAKVVAGGEQQNVEGIGYYFFIWQTTDLHRYLPAQAFDSQGNMLYEIEPNKNDWPNWVVATQ